MRLMIAPIESDTVVSCPIEPVDVDVSGAASHYF